MKKLINKLKLPVYLFTAILVALAGILIYSYFNPKEAAAWWDETWGYRQKVEIANTGSAQTDFQVQITLDSQTLEDAGKIQSDCDDLRITDLNGNLLNFWIEPTTCSTSATKIWVKVPSVPASGATVYLYYGNPSASSGQVPTSSVFIREISNVVASWALDETSSPNADSSGNGNNTTWYGNTTYTSGKFSNALSLPGGSGSYVGIADSPSIDAATSTITLSYWVKPASIGSDVGLITKHRQSTSPISGWHNYLLSTGQIAFQLRAGGVCCQSLNTTTVLSADNWYHVVSTYDGSTMKVYINGVQDLTTQSASGSINSTQDINIGRDVNTGSAYFSGQIDNVKIYNGVLTAPEITDLYGTGGDRQGYTTANYANKELVRKYSSVTVGSPASEEKSQGPVAYWSFNEGFGQTTQDSTSNNNDGTLGASAASSSDDPSWTAEDQCISGKCLSFDGGDYVNIGTPSTLSLTSSFTLSSWVRTSQSTGVLTIISKYDGGQKANYYLSIASGKSRVYLGSGSTCGSLSDVYRTGATTVSDGIWHFIESVYDASNQTLKVFVDGKDDSGTLTGTVPSSLTNCSTAQVEIGDAYAQSGRVNFFTGFIDEPKIYNYARTAAQIKADYASRGGSKGAAAVMGQATQDFMSNGLVGYWKMDESSWSGVAGEVVDSSGNGRNGVRAGNATTTGGKFGPGGTFDGTGDYVDIGTGTPFLKTTPFSGSAWVKSSAATGTIVTNWNITVSPGWEFSVGALTSEKMQFIITDTGGENYFAKRTNSSFNDGNWHHFAFTYDGSATATGIKLYVDGVEQATTTHTLGTTNPGTLVDYDMRIGSRSYTPDLRQWNGQLDEVRIYNRALSAKEASDLYNFAPGPVLHLKMDEKVSGDSKTLNDSSGYGNNGTTVDGANNTGMDCSKPGKYGASCSFDGTDDYVTVAHSNTLSIPGSIALEAWVNLNTIPAADGVYIVLAKDGTWSTTGTNYQLDIRQSGKIEFAYRGADSSANEFKTTNNVITSTNTWYHLAVTYDGINNPVIYVNGVPQAGSYAAGGNTALGTNSNILYVGAFTGPSLYLPGKIDDVKIYNYARSAGQILADYGTGLSQKQPVAHYRFDEGNGQTANNSGNGGSSLNGTLGANSGSSTDDPTWTNSGKFGKALNFDGSNDYISISDNTALDPTDAMSISMWCNVSSLSIIQCNIGKHNTEADTGYTFFLHSNNTFYFQLGKGTSWPGYGVNSSAITSTGWYHVVGTHDANNHSIYVNGKLAGTATGGTASQNTKALWMGRNAQSTEDYYPGIIDEVKIYNYALTADEIKTEYNSGQSLVLGALGDNASAGSAHSSSQQYCIPGDSSACNPPAAEWSFDEGGGTSVKDTSGNNNTGTWNGTGAKHWTQGKIGKAGNFNGSDDYVDAGDSTSLDIGISDFTISAWFKLTDNTQLNSVIVEKRVVGSPYTGYVLYFQDDVVGGCSANSFRGQVNAGTLTDRCVAAGYDVRDGKWHHIEWTVDRDSATGGKFYLDGAQIGTGQDFSSQTATIANIVNFSIGKSLQFDNDLSKGLIDQIKIYNYARSAAQVAWDYNRGAPVGHWKFDECQGNSLKDWSGNNNHGTITIGSLGSQTTGGTCTAPTDGTGAWYNGATGKFNSSLKFDGTDDYVDLGDPASGLFDFGTGNFAISAWVKTTTQVSDFVSIVSKYDNAAYNFWIQLGSEVGNKKVHCGWHSGTYMSTSTTTTVNDGNWHNIVCMRDGSTTGKLYVDGILKVNGTGQPNSNLSNDEVVSLGRIDVNVYMRYFNGQIDDVRIYNYALTATQVKNVYNEGSAVRFGP